MQLFLLSLLVGQVAVAHCHAEDQLKFAIHLFSGDTISGERVEWTRESNLKVALGSEQTKITSDRIDTIEFVSNKESKVQQATAIQLSNGDLLFTAKASFRDEQLTIELANHEIKIPIEFVRSMTFKTSTEHYQESDSSIENQDVVILGNGDRVQGELVEVNSATVTIDSQVGLLILPRPRVDLIQMNKDLIEEPDQKVAEARIYLLDGSFFIVRDLEISSAKSICRATILAGHRIELNLSDIARIEMLGTSLRTRSQMNVVSQTSETFFGEQRSVCFDRDTSGQLLKTGSRIFASGFGVRASSKITLAVPENAQAFSCLVGFDERIQKPGSVVVRLLQADEVLWETVLEANAEPQKQIRELSVTPGSDLDLIVEFGKRADFGDRVNWCRPLVHVRP